MQPSRISNLPAANPLPRYRQILLEEFQARVGRNPAYSMRSFARDLNLAQSGLSRLLSGGQGLSLSKAITIAKKLELSPLETQQFCQSVSAEHARSKKQRQLAQQALQTDETSAADLSLQYFKVMSDWHYCAIVELTTVKGFKNESKWIAKRLGLDESTVTNAIQILLKLELLEKASSGELRKTEDFRIAGTEVPSRSIRNYHRQVLRKAEESLDAQDIAKREFGSVALTLNPADLQWAKNEIRKFRNKFTRRLSAAPDKTRLYQFSMQLFSLDKLDDEETL